MTRIVDDYERLHAQIVVNNREAYAAAEVVLAERFLASGEPAPFLRAGRAIFMQGVSAVVPA
jgi:hypothetical protein